MHHPQGGVVQCNDVQVEPVIAEVHHRPGGANMTRQLVQRDFIALPFLSITAISVSTNFTLIA